MNSVKDFDKLVTQFMNDFGGTCIVNIKTAGRKDPVTGLIVQTNTPYEVRAILLDVERLPNGVYQANGTTVQVADKVAYIKPPEKDGKNYTLPAIDPVKDTFTAGGYEYTVVSYKDANPDTTNSIYVALYLKR